MKPVFDRVAETIHRYSMAPPGSRLGIAVSGGADSVFLLHALHHLAPAANLQLTVLHLNHQLRGADSDADARFVESLAADLGWPAILECAQIPAANLEAEARQARLDFFRRTGLDQIATGHTLDDQAETVLYRLMRGSGLAGLAGILPVVSGTPQLVRPLLWLRRAEIRDFLEQNQLSWREDATNLSTAYARNRIRHQLLPALAEFNPSIAPVLARTAALAQSEEDYWEAEIARLEHLLLSSARSVRVLASELQRLHPALGRRLLRRAVRMMKGDLQAIGAAHIEGILALATQDVGHGRLQIPGLDIFRSFDWLRIGLPKTGTRQERDYDLPLPVPGAVSLPGTDLVVNSELIDIPENGLQSYNSDTYILDADRAHGPLRVRNWRPGDRYSPVGGEEKKIKILFQEWRVPIWERQPWPVITSGDRIVWVRRFGPAVDCAKGEQTSRGIRISVHGELS